MITVNLLPEEFRVKEKSQSQIKYMRILLIAGILFGAATAFMYMDFLVATATLKGLESQWATKHPEFQRLTTLRNEVENTLKIEKDFMEKYATTRRPLTEIMVIVSEYLPDTAWLTEMKLERSEEAGDLMVKGSVIPSREQSSIEIIENYLQKIKNDIPGATLSLTTTRQRLEQVTLTQFIAHFSWKGAPEV